MMMFVTFGFMTPMTMGIGLVIALIVFGPGKLPELGKSLGNGIKEFKTATNLEENKEVDKSVKTEITE